MSRLTTSLFLSGALVLGATSAHAALPGEATLYKNPQCGCCDAYARHLEELGVEVTIIDDVELGDIKQQAGVPYGLGSCHTIEMGAYWIEGHVPMEAVQALFEQQPDVDGIGLADMPYLQRDTLFALQQLATHDTIVRPCFKGQPGHPVIFGRSLWPALQTLSGDAGAKDIIRRHTAHYREYAVQDNGTLIDIDVPEEHGITAPAS